MINGEDTGPLAGWVIAISNGKTLLGRFAPGFLSPVYELVAMMQMVQPDLRSPPQLMTLRQCLPLLTFPSLTRVDLPEDAILVQVAELSSKERRELAKSVEACEQLMASMRAQESGLVLAPSGAKLPPARRL